MALCGIVGLAPGEIEEQQGAPWLGPAGLVLRQALEEAGLDPERDVAYLNLTRCRPPDDRFDTKERKIAEDRCQTFLEADLAPFETLPLLLAGTRALQRMTKNADLGVEGYRGLWVSPRHYSVRHPANILRTLDPGLRLKRDKEFTRDVARFVARIQQRETPYSVSVKTITTWPDAQTFLKKLMRWLGPWAFDLETYDAQQCPSRSNVATDPSHPDFRVRGIAFAWSAQHGAWLDLQALDVAAEGLRPLLAEVFASSASKRTFHGSFDVEGLIATGWAPSVEAREDDPWLALIALSDGRRSRGALRLERSVVDILGWPQYWSADKSRMAEHPVEVVADGAVRDACATFALTDVLRARLEAGEYME